MSTVLNVKPAYSADELFKMPRPDRFELVAGELVPMSPLGGTHRSTSISISAILYNHVADNDLGTCFIAETGFKVASNPDTVLAPDFAFISPDRCPVPIPDGNIPHCPDFVVESRSPSDSPREVLWKVKLWQSYGARLVWDLDPKNRQLNAYHATGSVRTFGIDDMVTGADVLPDLIFPPRKVFPQVH